MERFALDIVDDGVVFFRRDDCLNISQFQIHSGNRAFFELVGIISSSISSLHEEQDFFFIVTEQQKLFVDLLVDCLLNTPSSYDSSFFKESPFTVQNTSNPNQVKCNVSFNKFDTKTVCCVFKRIISKTQKELELEEELKWYSIACKFLGVSLIFLEVSINYLF